MTTNNTATEQVTIEGFNVGDRNQLGSYTLTLQDIISFAEQWDPQFFHTDPERALSEGFFGGIIASGIQTMAVFQRLSVQSFSQNIKVIGGAGIKDLQFRRPVYPDDTLTGSLTVTAINFETERKRALITYAGELLNQREERVLVLTISVYVQTNN
ncbi:MaoC/PaaZ C-terminal domain-containing protein [Psychrobacter urativorans]|uniref:MaoC/PaaZ C-terminal domain-containing protein n=1 Tax=Psychrobacter urativorans TaxID=45610 RepID=UPI00191A62B9|nr:MaoC/PaaZ C-terminal domain-containing protein [Psychrobacter urativorans]